MVQCTRVEQILNFSSRELKLPTSEVEKVSRSLCQMAGVKAVCYNSGQDLRIVLTTKSEHAMNALLGKVASKIGHAVDRHKAATGVAEEEAIEAWLKTT